MHEVGILEATIDSAVREMHARGGRRIHRISLRIGVLSGVDPDALRFAFDAVVRGSPAADAELELEAVPARAHCATCQELFAVDADFISECPRCRQLSADIRQGRELELFRLEIS